MLTSRKQTQNLQNKIIKELEALPDNPKVSFTPFEDDMIRKYYPLKGGVGLAKILKKKYSQIGARASRLGVKKL